MPALLQIVKWAIWLVREYKFLRKAQVSPDPLPQSGAGGGVCIGVSNGGVGTFHGLWFILAQSRTLFCLAIIDITYDYSNCTKSWWEFLSRSFNWGCIRGWRFSSWNFYTYRPSLENESMPADYGTETNWRFLSFHNRCFYVFVEYSCVAQQCSWQD